MLSLPTPPKCFAASVHATLHIAFARKVRARPSDFSTFEAIPVHLRYGPVTCSPPLKMALSIGFRIVSFLPSCYSSYGALDSYPGGTLTHWLMPAFTGRTLLSTDPPVGHSDVPSQVTESHKSMLRPQKISLAVYYFVTEEWGLSLAHNMSGVFSK